MAIDYGSFQWPPTGAGTMGVSSLNSLTGALAIVAGSGITVTPLGSNITIAATGAGSGTVTSVGLSLPAEFTVSNSPVTTSGTLTAVWASEAQNLFLASPNGSSGTPSFRAIVAADVPTLNQNTTGTASNVTGIVALINGGTGVAAASANAAFNALSPLTTKGDLVAYSTVNARLPVGTNGQVLTADSGQALGVKWETLATGNPTIPTTTVLTSGSGNYTPPAGTIWIYVKAAGGGGGGGGAGGSPTAGSNGGNTTFDTLTANGGNGGNFATNVFQEGGTGGTASGGFINISGMRGGGSSDLAMPSGTGGGNLLGTGGASVASDGNTVAGYDGLGFGVGGSGAPNNPESTGGCGGGGAGYCEAIMAAGTYAYSIGAAGTGGSAGSSGAAGGNGASGAVVIIEHYNY